MRGARLRVSRIALLLFASGFCALVYQVVWLRQLRLVFGASTAATAAVLVLFMGGLGAGSSVLGGRAESKERPLAFYARLEAGVALAAAASPFLVDLVEDVDVALGGMARLGAAATVLHLVLVAVVLGAPAFWMGGTLPAAARSVEIAADGARRHVAWLQGARFLGAVVGVLVTTFFAVEFLGLRATLWSAAGLNLLVAALAGILARTEQDVPPTSAGDASDAAAAPASFVLASAALAGFAFLLLGLVWHRMLAPVLGGSSYASGLALAVALLGVGLGGLVYGLGSRQWRPGVSTLAWTSAAGSVVVALPLAAGDRMAVTAMLLRPAGDVSFALLVATWTVVIAAVVLPAAFVMGYQFSLLVALLGRGSERVAQQIGRMYGWIALGAIAGSVTGFGLLPLLTAPGAWRLAAGLYVALAVGVLVVSLRARKTAPAWSTVPLAAVAVALLMTPGPSAVWRHTPIGAGAMPSSFGGPNGVREMTNAVRRGLLWEAAGRQSSVAVRGLQDITFLVNGRTEGSALKDAPARVMSGLIGAMLHPEPKRALVIGLGTGSSAGWLAEVASIEQVDVVELEPAVEHVAHLCAPVNHDVLAHPKVRLTIGDARGLLLTTSESYDVIVSEALNPHRADVAGLLTLELYEAAASRLGEDGLFLQGLRTHEVDSQVLRTVYATLGSVFPHVETWQVHTDDLLLVASRSPLTHDLPQVRDCVAREPYRSALANVFGVVGAEGLYSAFVASAELATAIRDAEDGRTNTDDRPVIELGARRPGRRLGLSVERVSTLARQRGEVAPPTSGGRLDPWRVLEARSARNTRWGVHTAYPASGDASFDRRVTARNAYVDGNLASAYSAWSSQSKSPESPIDRVLSAEVLAEAGDPRAADAITELESHGRTPEAAMTRARWLYRQGDLDGAVLWLRRAFLEARSDPWIHRPVLERALVLATSLASTVSGGVEVLFAALQEPFAVRLLDDRRLRARLEIAGFGNFRELCVEAFAPFEPHVPWEESFLRERRRCFEEASHPLAPRARADYESFMANAPPRLLDGM